MAPVGAAEEAAALAEVVVATTRAEEAATVVEVDIVRYFSRNKLWVHLG